jgi:hypothetical protein
MAMTRTFFLLATIFSCEALLYLAWSGAAATSIAWVAASSSIPGDGGWIGAGAIAFCAMVSLTAGAAQLRTRHSAVAERARGHGSCR